MSLNGTGRRAAVLVLNATYEPINVCSVRRAAVLLLKEKAEMIERESGALHSERLSLARPAVVRLLSYVKIPHGAHRRRITRRAVLARDAWTCQYCGASASNGARGALTIDHVVPRSRGGGSVWENIVASCAPCNRRKGDRLPREASMQLRHPPKAPSPQLFIRIASPQVHPAWEPYLATA